MLMTNNQLNSTIQGLIAYLESRFKILFRTSPRMKDRYKYVTMQAKVNTIRSRVNNGQHLPIKDIPSIVEELTCLNDQVENASDTQNACIQALFSPLNNLVKTIQKHQAVQHKYEAYQNGQRAASDKIACLYQHTNDDIVEKIGKKHYTKDKFMSYIISDGGSSAEYIKGASDVFDDIIGNQFEPSTCHTTSPVPPGKAPG